MKKIDARKIGKEAQQQLRYIAVKRRTEGNTALEIAKILDIHPSSVRKGWRIYKKDGRAGLLLKKRGSRPGTGLKLNLEQLKILKKSMIDKLLSVFKLPHLLLTRKTVNLLILKLWNIYLSLSTIRFCFQNKT